MDPFTNTPKPTKPTEPRSNDGPEMEDITAAMDRPMIQTITDPIRPLKETLRRVMYKFANEFPAANAMEEASRKALETQLRQVPSSWQYLCGIAEGVNILTEIMPASEKNLSFIACARLLMHVSAKLALEAMAGEEDFPLEL